MILDNYGTHAHPKVQEWFAAHPRYHPHFTPTSASWLNLVKRWFAELTRKHPARHLPQRARAHPGHPPVPARVERRPEALQWTATVSSIMRKIRHCQEALETGH